MGASSQNYGGGNTGGGKSTGGGYQGNYNQGYGGGYGNNQTFGNSFGNDYRSNRFGGGPLNGSPMDQPIPLPGRSYGGGRGGYNQPQMNQPQIGMGKSSGPASGGLNPQQQQAMNSQTGFMQNQITPQQTYNDYANVIYGQPNRNYTPNFNQPQQQAMNSQTAFMQNQITPQQNYQNYQNKIFGNPGQTAPTTPTPQPDWIEAAQRQMNTIGIAPPLPTPEPLKSWEDDRNPATGLPYGVEIYAGPYIRPGMTPDPNGGGGGGPAEGYDFTNRTKEQRLQDYYNANNSGISMVIATPEQYGLTMEDVYGAPSAPAAPAAPASPAGPIPQAIFTPQAPQYQQAQTAYKPPVSTNTARINAQQQQMAATRARIPK